MGIMYDHHDPFEIKRVSGSHSRTPWDDDSDVSLIAMIQLLRGMYKAGWACVVLVYRSTLTRSSNQSTLLITICKPQQTPLKKCVGWRIGVLYLTVFMVVVYGPCRRTRRAGLQSTRGRIDDESTRVVRSK